MKALSVLLCALNFLVMDQLLSQESLPLGSHPPALPFEHFPNRMYAVIWRNWNLVDPDRIAQTIGCTAEDIHSIAASMGLPPAQPIPPGFRKQIYITVLRRNWHLLPYDQLLNLADMTPQELEFSLKEDDFLFHKFGNLKPACLPLKYTAPNPQERAIAWEIKQLVRKKFKKSFKIPAEPFSVLYRICVIGICLSRSLSLTLRKQRVCVLSILILVFLEILSSMTTAIPIRKDCLPSWRLKG